MRTGKFYHDIIILREYDGGPGNPLRGIYEVIGRRGRRGTMRLDLLDKKFKRCGEEFHYQLLARPIRRATEWCAYE